MRPWRTDPTSRASRTGTARSPTPTADGSPRLSRGGPSGLPGCDPRRDLVRLDRLGGTLLVPGDPRWPAALDDLGPEAPFCLWVRGEPDLGATLAQSAAVVGSRAATSYGERVAFDLADGLTAEGVCVVSGGAYGIDAAAHRGAVARGGRTVVVLAGGVDRAYPAGNARLLEAVVEAGGRARVGGAARQSADEEPLPGAEPPDRRGRSRHGRGRGGVAVGRDEHGAPRGTAPSARRCRAGPRDVDGVRRLPPVAAGGRRGVRDGRRRGA